MSILAEDMIQHRYPCPATRCLENVYRSDDGFWEDGQWLSFVLDRPVEDVDLDGSPFSSAI